MKTLISWLLIFGLPCGLDAPVRAEIAVANSIQWLCAGSDLVVQGRITRVHAPKGGTGKNTDLVSLTVVATEIQDAKREPDTYYIGVRSKDPGWLRTYRRSRTELLFFLNRSIQAYSFDGHSYHLWPVRGPDGQHQVIDLSKPVQGVFDAVAMDRPKDRKDLLDLCRASIEALERERAKLRDFEPEHKLLQIPVDSPAHRALYSGSTTYLWVPGFLFPRAQKGFH